jgi:hypothetical protein
MALFGRKRKLKRDAEEIAALEPITGQYLFDQFKAILPMMVIGGGSGQAQNIAQGWGMIWELKTGRPTGRLGVICYQVDALNDFTDLARRDGHIVEPWKKKDEYTVMVTPKLDQD